MTLTCLGDQEVHDQPVHVLLPDPDARQLALPLIVEDLSPVWRLHERTEEVQYTLPIMLQSRWGPCSERGSPLPSPYSHCLLITSNHQP